jgi:hypothetical protein
MYGTSEQVRELTGVTAKALGQNITDDQLTAIIETWLGHVAAEINNRLRETVLPADSRYKGIEAVALRTVAKLVGYAVQNRTTKVVQVGEFAIRVLDASDVTRELDRELRPYIKRRISIFHSGEKWVDPDASTL